MPARRAAGLDFLQCLGQRVSAVPALIRQHRPELIDSLRRRQPPARSLVPGLPAYLAFALRFPATFSLLSSQPIRGGGLDDVVEFWSFAASFRSRSSICFPRRRSVFGRRRFVARRGRLAHEAGAATDLLAAEVVRFRGAVVPDRRATEDAVASWLDAGESSKHLESQMFSLLSTPALPPRSPTT